MARDKVLGRLDLCNRGSNIPQSVVSGGETMKSMRHATLRMSRGLLCGVVAIVGLEVENDPAVAKSHDNVAVSATVTGKDQGVGFRALVMKQAIAYNLAGVAKNAANDVVAFTLQGRAKRIDKAVATIRDGTRRSSNIVVTTSPAAVDPKLDTFTIVDWTSTTRGISTPYTLVFRLRSGGEAVSRSEAKEAWHEILRTTLQGDDLKKLRDDD